MPPMLIDGKQEKKHHNVKDEEDSTEHKKNRLFCSLGRTVKQPPLLFG